MTTRHLYTLSNLLVITVVIFAGVDIFYRVMGSHLQYVPSHGSVERTAQSQRELPPPAFSDYAVVVERDLFQTKQPILAKKPEPVVQIKELKETKLKLRLLGTVTGEGSYAVILDDVKKKQDLFREGDAVQTAQLRQILRGKVVLRVGEQDEVLSMEKVPSPGGGAEEASPAAEPEPEGQRVEISRAEIQKSIQNINQLMTQVRVRPHFEEGRPSGLSLSRILPDSIFAQMGLLDGDVLEGIDDQSIRSVDQILSLYKALKSAERVSLRVKREGRSETISYHFK